MSNITCPYCGKNFTTVDGILSHIDSEHYFEKRKRLGESKIEKFNLMILANKITYAPDKIYIPKEYLEGFEVE